MEKKVFEKVVFCANNIMYISSRVQQASGRDQTEQIFRIYIFQDPMKKAKLSTPASISKRLQSHFLTYFSFDVPLIAIVKARHALLY